MTHDTVDVPQAERFAFRNWDGGAAFWLGLIVFFNGGLGLGLPFMSWHVLAVTSVIYLLLVPWLDCTILVVPGRVRLARRLCRIPYYWYTGAKITDVCYDSDWDEESTATGVVVSIDCKEFHIVAPRRKTALHASLARLMRAADPAGASGVGP